MDYGYSTSDYSVVAEKSGLDYTELWVKDIDDYSSIGSI